MNPFVFIGIFIATFAVMEVITWLTHRYVMHGFLWYLHEDHHQKGPGFFEKNDAFFLIFGVPTFLGILYGTIYSNYLLQAICYGVMAYGVAYFIVHDVIIHQRFKWFTRSNNTYVRAIRWGHKMHHKHLDKHEGECFGMLVVHKKYWDKIRRDKKLQQSLTAHQPETAQQHQLMQQPEAAQLHQPMHQPETAQQHQPLHQPETAQLRQPMHQPETAQLHHPMLQVQPMQQPDALSAPATSVTHVEPAVSHNKIHAKA